LVTLAAIVVWIATLTGLILTAPPAGAASPADLVEQATAALNSGDVEAFSVLLTQPLDQDFAKAYLARLQNAGAHQLVVTPGPGDLIEVRGRHAPGHFRFDLVAVTTDGRWFLSPLPPI
jgi:isopentenyl diphosphate isomerase/L-lactate dehydrogenase-like FMN-dependent dehydrogenase